MIDKKTLIESEWKNIDTHLKKDNPETLRLAVIEAENTFLRLVAAKGYKARSLEEKVSLALKEISRPEVFIKARETALSAKNQVGFRFEDPYSGREAVDTYRESIEEMLFGIIDEKRGGVLKYRFWRLYYPFFSNRKKIYKIVAWALFFILLMLFIADTDLGKNAFDYLIDKIHLIIRTILFVLFLAFAVLFFVTFAIILLESRTKRRYAKKKSSVDN